MVFLCHSWRIYIHILILNAQGSWVSLRKRRQLFGRLCWVDRKNWIFEALKTTKFSLPLLKILLIITQAFYGNPIESLNFLKGWLSLKRRWKVLDGTISIGLDRVRKEVWFRSLTPRGQVVEIATWLAEDVWEVIAGQITAHLAFWYYALYFSPNESELLLSTFSGELVCQIFCFFISRKYK